VVFPDDVRQILQRRYKNSRRAWVDGEGQWPLAISLGIPTQLEASSAPGAVRTWVEAWNNWRGLPGELTWEERRWRWLGAQRLPAHLLLASPEEAAEWVGEGARWGRVILRRSVLTRRWPSLAVAGSLSSHFDALADYSDVDFDRLIRLVGWLVAHRRSGLYPRQLPAEGVDTKWLDGRRSLITDLIQSIFGIDETDQDFHTICGLQHAPTRIRMRVLCPGLRNIIGGLRDVEAPVEEVARLPLMPESVLIVENLETGLALPDIACTIVILKLGLAVALLGDLQWIASRRCLYWGDIDTYGYLILDRARRCLPQLKSLLMDETTLLAHRALWTEELTQCSAEELSHLEAHERDVFSGLRTQKWGTNVRLEQERIPWEYGLLTLERVGLRLIRP